MDKLQIGGSNEKNRSPWPPLHHTFNFYPAHIDWDQIESNLIFQSSPVRSDFFGVRCKKTQSVVIHFSLNVFRSFQSDLVWSGLVWYGPVSSVCIQQCTPKRLDRIRPDQTVILVKILLIVMDWKKLATHTNQIFSPITSLQWALSFRRRLGNCRPWCNCPLVNAKGFVLVQPPGECVSN